MKVCHVQNRSLPAGNSHDNVGFGVGVNLPVWQDKLRAGVREAEHRVLESARRYDAVRDDTFRLIKRLIVRARALDRQIKLFEKSIIPRAEQTLRISVADYQVGKVDFQQIIDNWTDLLAFRIQLARLKAGLKQTLASLERVVGCQLALLPDIGVESGSDNAKPIPPEPSGQPTEASRDGRVQVP